MQHHAVLVASQLAAAGQVQVALLYQSPPGRLVGGGGAYAAFGGGVLEFPVAAVLIEYTGVAGVDGDKAYRPVKSDG